MKKRRKASKIFWALIISLVLVLNSNFNFTHAQGSDTEDVEMQMETKAEGDTDANSPEDAQKQEGDVNTNSPEDAQKQEGDVDTNSPEDTQKQEGDVDTNSPEDTQKQEGDVDTNIPEDAQKQEGDVDTNSPEEPIDLENDENLETTMLSGTIKWEYGNNQDIKHPESAEIQLYSDENTIHVASLVVTESNGWSWNFEVSIGKEYTIKVEGIDVEYKYKIDGPSTDNVLIITCTSENSNVSETEKLDDENNQEAKSPEITTEESTTNEVEKSQNTTEEGITENNPKQNMKYGSLLTNIISGTIIWDDNNNQDGKRPEEVTINVLANGEKIGDRIVKASENWEWSYANLPKYKNGEKITYTITQEEVTGYETKINGYNVTNTLEASSIDEPYNITIAYKPITFTYEAESITQDSNGNYVVNLTEESKNQTEREIKITNNGRPVPIVASISYSIPENMKGFNCEIVASNKNTNLSKRLIPTDELQTEDLVIEKTLQKGETQTLGIAVNATYISPDLQTSSGTIANISLKFGNNSEGDTSNSNSKPAIEQKPAPTIP